MRCCGLCFLMQGKEGGRNVFTVVYALTPMDKVFKSVICDKNARKESILKVSLLNDSPFFIYSENLCF
jgi:hypothetical protein